MQPLANVQIVINQPLARGEIHIKTPSKKVSMIDFKQ